MSVKTSDIELNIAQQVAAKKPQQILLPHLTVDLVKTTSPHRKFVEQYIAKHFYKSHKADVDTFLPYVLCSSTKKNITSTVGFRLASDSEPLFLEQYLEGSVETTLAELLGESVKRTNIAEIGNLTSSYPGASQMLFVLVVATLYQLGVGWALFTVTPQVQKMVDDLGIESVEICDANPACLNDNGESWGGYYKNKPKVIAGNLADAYSKLSKHPVASFMMCNYKHTVNTIVKHIRQ